MRSQSGFWKFLGYMISCRGIKVNLDQIRSIQQLRSPSNPKEVQKLTGMIAALNRFVSKSVDKCRPFFQLLKKWKGFSWTPECDEAFQKLKEYLAKPPILSSPEPGEDLCTYQYPNMQ